MHEDGTADALSTNGKGKGLKAVELFAGVGGFRLALERHGHQVVWSNQWEPGKKQQWASECYVRHFGADGHVNDDIATVDAKDIPDHDLLVGGFPCQDYSVATTLHRAGGIRGKKGVLWWQIERILRAKRPPYVLLENVDRLLRSPASQRGRDFGVLLWCLQNLGYRAEWRVINAADHGFPQRRRRTFIFAAQRDTSWGRRIAQKKDAPDFLETQGFFAHRFPVVDRQAVLGDALPKSDSLDAGLQAVSDDFRFDFDNAGVLAERSFWSRKVFASKEDWRPLRTVLEKKVPERYSVPEHLVERWRYLKGPKSEERVSKANGHRYHYTEGGIPFPDKLDLPSRTLLTGEGGTSPSRLKHLIEDPDRPGYRVLTPVECERLNGFPDGWTEGIPERWRYFTMGNALVVGVVERMAQTLATTTESASRRRPPRKKKVAAIARAR